MQSIRIALGCETKVPGLAFVAEFFKRRHDFAQDLVDSQHSPDVAWVFQGVVELEDIDVVLLQPVQTGFERGPDRLRDVALVLLAHADFRADENPVAVAAERSSQVLLGSVVAVRRRRIEVIDTLISGPGNGTVLVRGAPCRH